MNRSAAAKTNLLLEVLNRSVFSVTIRWRWGWSWRLQIWTDQKDGEVRDWWGWSEQIFGGVSEKRRSPTHSVPYPREEGCGCEDGGGGRERWWWNKGWWKNIEGRKTQRREEEDWVCCFDKNAPTIKSEMSKLLIVTVLCLVFCVQLSLLYFVFSHVPYPMVVVRS